MTNKKLRAAVLQMVSSSDLDDNLRHAEKFLREAAAAGCELVVLPENFAVLGAESLPPLAESEKARGPILRFLAEMSKTLQLWIVGGTAPFSQGSNGDEGESARVYAGSSVWNSRGELVCRYDKMHLFDVAVDDSVGQYCESKQFIPGASPVACPTPWGMLGLSVCYDLRFPELYRKLVEQGATMLSVPAAFTYATGEAHWEVLLRARAIENQCFVFAPNQGGDHGRQRITWGHSCIVDPWGKMLAVREQPGWGLAIADLNFDRLDEIRSRMPVLMHRRM